MTNTINIQQKYSLFSALWEPKIIGQINDMHVKIVRIEGEFDWHVHKHEDEMFFVLEGTMDMGFHDRNERVEAGEMIIVPKGVEHRPASVGGECKIMLLEPASTLNTGDNEMSDFTVPEPERL